MQVRKFEAEDMRAALTAVKQAMGADAVIIATRTLQQGGLFARTRIEVTAALEDASSALASRADGEEQRADDLSTLQTQIEEMRQLLLTLGAGESSLPTAPMIRLLEAAGVEHKLASRLEARARALGERSQVGIANGRRALAAAIIEVLGAPFSSTHHGQQVVALVGPTGVGKTTTLAKLAAHAALLRHQRVGLVTLDTYRVGGIEQLHAYADLIGLGLVVARDKEGFQHALERFTDCDVVFVDTAGRGPGDSTQVQRVAEILSGAPVDIHLTVDASTGHRNLRRIIERYEGLCAGALLFTKLDETTSLTSVLNGVAQSGKPLSFVSFGQRVPEDLAHADAQLIASKIVDDVLPQRSGKAAPTFSDLVMPLFETQTAGVIS